MPVEEIYTQKEMLARMQVQLDRIETKLDGKADQAELDRLSQRVTVLEQHISPETASNTKRIDLLERWYSDPTSTAQGRQGLELVAQYKQDHEFLDSLRTLVAFGKFLGVGGIIIMALALANYVLHGVPPPGIDIP